MTEHAFKSDFLRTMQARGYINQITHPAELDEAATNGVVTGYIGFDATAASLHVGHLIQIMLLRRLQQAGHKPIVLMGGGTTKVGDPSFKDTQRPLLTEEKIAENIAGIKGVFEKFLTFGDGPSDAIMVDNDEWLSKLGYLQFLRDYGTHFTINRMLSFGFGQAAPGPRAAADLPRIQLHADAGHRLPGAEPPLRLPAADGRIGPVGQHHQRRRTDPQGGPEGRLRPDHDPSVHRGPARRWARPWAARSG